MTPILRTLLHSDPHATRIGRVGDRALRQTALTVGPSLLLAGAALVALAVGLLVPEYGMLALAALLAAAVGGVAMLRPEVGLFLFTMMMFTRASENLTLALGIPSTAPLFAVALLTALVAREGLGSLFRGRRVYWMPFAVYGFVLLASVFVAVNDAVVLTTVNIYVKEMVFAGVIVLYARTIRDTRTIVWALLLGGLLPSLFSIYQTFTGSTYTFLEFGQYSAQIVIPGEIVEVPRPSGHIGDPNFYALSLLILIPLAMHRFRYERAKALRILAAFTLCAVTLAVVLTYSRGAYVALAFTVMAAVLAGYVRLRSVLIVCAVVALLIPVVPARYTQRLSSLFDIATTVVQEEGVEEPTTDSSYEGRMVQLLAGVHMFFDYPTMGVGTHNYPEHYQEYARPLGTVRRANRTPHNLYVEIAAETGLVGLAAYTLMVGSIGVWLRDTWRSPSLPIELRDLARALAVSLVAYLAGSIFLHNAYPRFWWITVALVLSTLVVSDERSRIRSTLRMRPIRRLDVVEDWRMRARIRLAGGAVAIVLLALVAYTVTDAQPGHAEVSPIASSEYHGQSSPGMAGSE